MNKTSTIESPPEAVYLDAKGHYLHTHLDAFAYESDEPGWSVLPGFRRGVFYFGKVFRGNSRKTVDQAKPRFGVPLQRGTVLANGKAYTGASSSRKFDFCRLSAVAASPGYTNPKSGLTERTFQHTFADAIGWLLLLGLASDEPLLVRSFYQTIPVDPSVMTPVNEPYIEPFLADLHKAADISMGESAQAAFRLAEWSPNSLVPPFCLAALCQLPFHDRFPAPLYWLMRSPALRLPFPATLLRAMDPVFGHLFMSQVGSEFPTFESVCHDLLLAARAKNEGLPSAYWDLLDLV